MIYLNCNKDEDGNPIFSFSKPHGSWYGKSGFPIDTDYDIYVWLHRWGFNWFFFTHIIFEGVWKNGISSILIFRAKAAVKNRKVVNDSSERIVRITYDFLEQARKEDRLQHIHQVVENNRKLIPNLRNNTSN